MTKERKKEIESLFRNYKANKKALREDYDFPSVSGVDFSRISIKSDKSRNVQEDKIINYADKKTKLYAQVYIVDEVIHWFELEGHGRERFIIKHMINGCSWVKAEMECCMARATLFRWKDEILDKANTIGGWLGYWKG